MSDSTLLSILRTIAMYYVCIDSMQNLRMPIAFVSQSLVQPRIV